MKLELYKPYKTRSGHKAVVVSVSGDCFYAWHDRDDESLLHYPDGRYTKYQETPEDIISEWVEPRKGEFWVNVYEGHFFLYDQKEKANSKFASSGRLALKHVTWTEGDEE